MGFILDPLHGGVPCCDFKSKEDIAEITRCKNCKWWQRNSGFFDSPNGICNYWCEVTNGYDYCSYGELKGSDPE